MGNDQSCCRQEAEIASMIPCWALKRTWPAQAEMAAAGEWDKLKAWQDELDGGKVVKATQEEE